MNSTEPRLRVSVAVLCRVVFEHAAGGPRLLALERKATRLGEQVWVRAQPFGGAVRILDPSALHNFGNWHYDSPQSQQEQDFRILITPERWPEVRQFCLQHLADPHDSVFETQPQRELAEEFADALQQVVQSGQYHLAPEGFVVENQPSSAASWPAGGLLTARIYRVYEVHIHDLALCQAIENNSKQFSDWDLEQLAWKDAQNGGKGRANAALTLPLAQVVEAYRATLPDQRFVPIVVDGHVIDASTAAVLPGVNVPQYERVAEP